MAVSKRIKGITIEIGADTKKLTDSIKEAEKQIGDAAYKLRDINKLLKMDPKNVELLTQKQKALTEAINGTKEKLQQEKQALEQMKNGPQTEETIRQQEALSREIVETEQKLKSLENEYKNFGSVAAQQTRAAGEEMQKAGQKLQNVGGGIASAGSTMTRYVTGPAVAAGVAVVKTAADFDSGMSKVQAISGATGDQMDSLRDKAKEMAASTKYDLNETAEAYSYMAMAGWKTEDMLNGIAPVMHLAAAAGEDLATTSDILTDNLTAFGLSASDGAMFADVMAAAATNSNTNVSMMGESFKYAAAPAHTLGYTVQDTALALGLMANNGIKADMAGTSLRNIFQRMYKPTKESQMAIEQLGLSLYDDTGKMYTFREVMYQIRDGFKNVKMSAEDYDAAVAALDADLEAGTITQKKYDASLEELNRNAFGAEEAERARAAAMLGGARATSALIAIAQSSEEDFDKLANAIDNSSEKMAKLKDGSVVPLSEALASGAEIVEEYNGQAEAMAAIMEDNLNGDITKLKSQLNVLAEEFGRILIPEVTKFVQSLSNLVQKFHEMPEGEKKAIVGIVKFLAVIGPVLLVVGKTIVGIGKLVEAIGTLKIALSAGGALANLGASISGLWASITAGLSTVGTSITTFLAGIGGTILTACATIASSVVAFFAGAEIGKTIGAYIFPDDAELYEQYSGITGTLEMLRDFFVTFGEETAEGFRTYWGNIVEATTLMKEQLAEKFLQIKTDFQAVGDALREYLPAKFNEIKENVINVVGLLKEGILYDIDFLSAGIRERIEIVKEIISGLVNGDLIERAKKWGYDLISGIIEGIKSGVQYLKDIVTYVANVIRERLHFSEPDVGPLSDFNSWMPDMMSQMAEQINEGVPGVASAIQNVAGTMQGGLQHDYTNQLAGINQSVKSLASAGGSGEITIPVYIGQSKFAQAVVDANQMNRFRNGGR